MENDDNNELKEWVKSSCSMREIMIMIKSDKLEVKVGENKRIKLSDIEPQPPERVKELQHQNRVLVKERDDMKAEIMIKSDKLEVKVGENKRIKLSDIEPQPERVKELQHQNRVLVKERDDMKAERDDLKEGRDAMEAERDAMEAERDAMEAERDALKEERYAIQQQQNMNIEKKRDYLNEMKEIADAYNGLTSKLREQLECPVCMEVPTSGPLHVCPNGHFVCATCKQEECPTCRIQMFSGKSLLAVTVIENIRHKCKHGDCEKLLYLADYKIHLEACPFNPRNRLALCPAPSELCGKEMELSKIYDHSLSDCKGTYNSLYKQLHNIQMKIDTPWSMKVALPLTSKGIAISCDDSIFYLRIEKLPFCSVFSIQLLGNLLECEKYVVNMSVERTGEKDGVVQKMTCKPLSIDQDQDVKKMKGLMIASLHLEEMAVRDEQGILRIKVKVVIKKI